MGRARLGRGWEHRVAMLRNMVTSLIQHERIETTLPRAKELSKLADKCVTMAKESTHASRVRAAAVVRTEEEVHKLFTLLATRYKDREGGYTRVVKSRLRMGDAAPMAFIEFVDRPGEIRTPRPPAGKRSAQSLLPLSAQAAEFS